MKTRRELDAALARAGDEDAEDRMTVILAAEARGDMLDPAPLVLRAITFGAERVQFFVDHGGATHKVVVPRHLLEDLDKTAGLSSADAVMRLFQRHETRIVARTLAALVAGRREDGSGAVVLGLLDFPEV